MSLSFFLEPVFKLAISVLAVCFSVSRFLMSSWFFLMPASNSSLCLLAVALPSLSLLISTSAFETLVFKSL